jgi:hypothetical protein
MPTLWCGRGCVMCHRAASAANPGAMYFRPIRMVVLLISYFESQTEIALRQTLVVATGASSPGLMRQRVANDEALRRSQLLVSTLTDSQLAHSVDSSHSLTSWSYVRRGYILYDLLYTPSRQAVRCRHQRGPTSSAPKRPRPLQTGRAGRARRRTRPRQRRRWSDSPTRPACRSPR